jgi:thioredoxin 1
MCKSILKFFLVTLFVAVFASAQQIGPKNFDSVINKKGVVIVKFWAPWCMPCSILKPEFNKAKAQVGKKVKFVEYNVDLRGKPLSKYNIQVIPTMVIFKNGKEVSRDSSILDSSAIVNWVKQYSK